MVDETTASVIPLHQVPPKRKAKTAAERAKAYRQRKGQKANITAVTETESLSADALKPLIEGLVPEPAIIELSITLVTTEMTHRPAQPVTPSRRQLAPIVLSIAAFALAAGGITINGWFAMSLGSSDAAG